MYIDIHLLQTMPYSNLNRDEHGSPKTMTFGNVPRSRLSSQAQKRPVRLKVETVLDDPAVRTKRLVVEVIERLTRDGWSEPEAEAAARTMLAAAGKGISTKKAAPARKAKKSAEDLDLDLDGDDEDAPVDPRETSVLLYLPAGAFDALAEVAKTHRALLANIKPKDLSSPTSADRKKINAAVSPILCSRAGTINLFGRMLTELPAANVDGAVQVAHAFTTHGSSTEIDFFAAVDDCLPKDLAGSGHIDSAEFTSGVFYRYANVDLAGLATNLGKDTDMARRLVTEFLRAFVAELPTGKLNSTAAASIPDLVYIAVRSDRPLPLAGAFEEPVRAADHGGHAWPSRRALADYADRIHGYWGRDAVVHDAHTGIDAKPWTGLGTHVTSLQELIDTAIAKAYPRDGQ